MVPSTLPGPVVSLVNQDIGGGGSLFAPSINPANGNDLMLTGWVPDWANGSAVIPPLFDGRQIPAFVYRPGPKFPGRPTNGFGPIGRWPIPGRAPKPG